MFQATHLIIFLLPCLGAFVLSNHSSHNSAFFKLSSPDAPANEGPTACVKQVANFPLPSLLPNQSDTLIKARAEAADGHSVALWLKLPSRLKFLCRTANGANTGTGPTYRHLFVRAGGPASSLDVWLHERSRK